MENNNDSQGILVHDLGPRFVCYTSPVTRCVFSSISKRIREKKHTSVHSAMHFCSMGLHVVVPGLIELTSRNKFVQRKYVHVHVRIFLNRKMFVHPCYAFIYNKKTPEN